MGVREPLRPVPVLDGPLGDRHEDRHVPRAVQDGGLGHQPAGHRGHAVGFAGQAHDPGLRKVDHDRDQGHGRVAGQDRLGLGAERGVATGLEPDGRQGRLVGGAHAQVQEVGVPGRRSQSDSR